MKKFNLVITLAMIALFSLFTACETDDEGVEEIPVETRILFIENADGELNITSQTDSTVSISIRVQILNVDPSEDTFSVTDNVRQIPFALNREGTSNIFSRDDVLVQDDFPESTPFFIKFSSPDDYLESNIIMLDLSTDSGGGSDLEKVHIISVSNTVTGNTMSVTAVLTHNSLNNGTLMGSLYKGGTLIGNDIKLVVGGTSPGSTAEIQFEPFTDNLITTGETYQFLIENVSESDVDNFVANYAFTDINNDIILDNNGIPVTSIDFDLVTQEPTATMENHAVEAGVNEFTINAEISTNIQPSQNIVAKLFPQGNTTAIYTSPNPYVTPSNSDNLIITDLVIDGLAANTNYDLKYFLNGSNTAFATYSIQTNTAGSILFDWTDVTNITPTQGKVGYVYNNGTGSSVDVLLRFSENGVVMEEYMLSMVGNSGQVIESYTTTGYDQISTLSYEAIINGQVVDSGSFITTANTYSAIANLNASGSTTAQAHTPNQTNVTSSIFRFNADGPGVIQEITFQFTNTTGLSPWDYLLLLGIEGNNVSVSNLANSVTEVTISNLSIPYVTGTNMISNKISNQNYTNDGDFEFNYRMIAKDDQGQIIGDNAQTLTVSF